MEQGLDELKISLWKRLEPKFYQYAESDGQLSNNKVQLLVRNLFQDSTQQDIDYVMKNMHRLDVDQSGKTSFSQFANFLFKRHCGQMSLQKRHLRGLMKRGSDRLMNYEQFDLLLDEAIKFLKMDVPNHLSRRIFDIVDKDKDAHITYGQYFSAIQRYICKSKKELNIIPKEPAQTSPAKRNSFRSRFREYLWEQLRTIYDLFIKGQKVAFGQVRELVVYILQDLSELELTYILSGLYALSGTYIEFLPFATLFFYLIGQVGLSRFSHWRQANNKSLSLEQFLKVFLNTYKFLNLHLINPKFIELFYYVIRGNKTYILYDDYLTWIREFIAAEVWYGQSYYVLQDDPLKPNGNSLFYVIMKQQKKRSLSPKKKFVRFHFSNNDLAYRVRQSMYNILIKFDRDNDKLFSESQVKQALISLLKEDKHQLHYVTKNVFRYDKDNDGKVTYQQLTNFSVEQHFGQMAIQRLHREKFYSRGGQRIMNKQQFHKTLNYALNCIQIQANSNQINILFNEIDIQRKGWITYQVYFMFLKYYFGSMSTAFLQPHIKQQKSLSFDEQLLIKLHGLSSYERFIKLLFEQLRFYFLMYDENKNLVFEPNEIENILIHIFKFNNNQIQLILSSIFKVDASYKDKISFEDLVSIILDIYFIQILLLRKFDIVGKKGWKLTKINLKEFIVLIMDACFFLKIKPFQEDLITIFNMLDTNRDGFITLNEFITFIRQYLGRNILKQEEIPPTPESPKKKKQQLPNISNQQYEFVNLIWSQLKIIFDTYDQQKKGYLNEQEFKKFAVQVLEEKSDSELKYIFWNLFRLDTDFDKKINFEEFAPYVLKHAGQISLQRFHSNQVKGKSALKEEQLFIIISNAYRFLKSMPKSHAIVKLIYHRIAKTDGVSYGSYLQWVNSAIARRFR